jgi:hypothetical protein
MKSTDSSVIRQSQSNPAYGSVMVKSTVLSMNNGFLNANTTNAFFRAPLELLNSLNLAEGVDLNSIVPVKVVTVDTFAPAYENHKPRVRSAANGGAPILSEDGRMIYRQSIVVGANDATTDTIIRTQRVNAPVAAASVASAVEGELA